MAIQDTKTPTLSSVINQGVLQALLETHTCLPAKIVSFDAQTQTANVQSMLKKQIITTDENDNETITSQSIDILIEVVVYVHGGGNYFFTAPIGVGDECLLLFAERGIDNWYDTGRESDPSGYRQHSLSDSFALVGINSKPNVIEDYSTTHIELRNRANNMAIRLNDDELDIQVGNTQKLTMTRGGNIVIENGQSTITLNGGNVTIDNQATMVINGDVQVNGTLTADTIETSAGIDLGIHTHGGVQTGGGTTGGPL